MVTKTERKRVREVQRLAEKAEPLQEFGEAGPGRGHVDPNKRPTMPRGMTKAYLVARIARDHPDILARMKAGEFATVRQAAIAAGILKDLTRVDQFQKLWRNASDEEHTDIALDVVTWLMWQDMAHRDRVYVEAGERMAAQASAKEGKHNGKETR